MVKNLPANAGDADLTPGSGRSPGEGHGNSQYSCLGNPRYRGVWPATDRGVAEELDTIEQLNSTSKVEVVPGWWPPPGSCRL